MLHVIGLAHRAQSRTPGNVETEAQQTFRRCLDQTIRDVHPAFIAEEDSEEAFAERHETSIGREISQAKGLEHRLCDPTREQRRALGYKDGQTLEIETFMDDDQGLSNDEIHLRARATEVGRYFPIRERVWLQQLTDSQNRDGIFVCGDAHIEGFTALLDRQGIRHRVVARGIGATDEERDDWGRIMEYLRTHPELRNG